MAESYRGVLFGNKKEGNTDTCYHEDEPENFVLSDKSQSQTTYFFHLYEKSSLGKSMETESKAVVA